MKATEGHICLLQERVNHIGKFQWSLLLNERCHCQGVAAPLVRNTKCSTSKEELKSLWFVKDPSTLTRRENWQAGKLDDLLERKDYCGKRTESVLFIVL